MRKANRLESRSLQHLKRFISENFENAWEMKMLVLLFRTSEQDWSPQELSAKLIMDCHSVEQSLSRLAMKGLVTCIAPTAKVGRHTSKYIYMPNSAEKRALSELLVTAYEKSSLAVNRMMCE
jgi:predicted transcriptional regulator